MPRLSPIAALLLTPLALLAAGDDDLFFESKVRPVLIKRCYECHSAEHKVKGGLKLDSRAGWQEGGDNGPAIVPGDLSKSLLIKAVRYQDEDFAMPPKSRLPADEVAILEEWVKRGAPDPRTAEAAKAAKPKRAINLEEGRKFWAFQPVTDPPVPAVKDTTWSRDPLDRFLLAKLEAKGLKPAGDADRHTWIRRVSLDLTGLPASAEEVIAFAGDKSDDAYAKVVDRLLASPAYGERWARHWLDLTGYADMIGTSNDVFAEHAWRYRDYLIQAFNEDKPFDIFIKEQLAGDLLPAASVEQRAEQLVATGFLMVGDLEIVNPDKAKMEADHIDTQLIKIGGAFLGMTMGCARCHDHKFDPIGLEDYYGIAGILRSSPSSGKMVGFGVWSTIRSISLPETPAQLAERLKAEAEHASKIVALKAEQAKLTEENKAVVAKLADLEKAAQARPAAAAGQSAPIATAPTPGPLPERDALTKRRDEIAALLKTKASEIQHAEFFKSKAPRAFAMQDGEKPADMPIYVRGNPYATAAVVPRGAVRVASWDRFPAIPEGQSGRLQLAEWIADRRNPLTARVTVNRLWQKLFGEGLVRSVDYFGERGERPSHPELLDHLATRFMADGWSQKRFLRGIVLSHAYRLTSANHAEGLRLDPENRLFWRMNRQRLEAEAIRDSLLKVSGELVPKAGGPSLALEIIENTGGLAAAGVNPPSYHHRKSRPSQEFERTVYLPVMRNGPSSADKIRSFFDFVDPAGITGQRNQTVMPTQSLFLLNNVLVRKHAGALAQELIAAHADEDARLEALWLRAWNRPISAEERTEAREFLQEMTPLLKKPRAPADLESARWQELCHSLLASNAFIYRL
ncbi:MAG: hypothetical protein RL105_1697 [Verrucomicrobiota bacterium]|jgi:hypothetical protein